MNIIRPITIDDTKLTSSTVPEDDYAEWLDCNFIKLNDTNRNWQAMAAAASGDVFAAVYGGTIYKQTAGAGAFTQVCADSRNWSGMCVSPVTGYIFACVNGGDIYRSTNGGTTFSTLSQGNKAWQGMCAAPNGNIYCCVNGGDIYKSTDGSGAFGALSQASLSWYGMCANAGGDIYCSVYNGSIYKRTAGTGDFVTLTQTSRAWAGMAVSPIGNVYCVCVNGDIYQQALGVGNFVGLDQTAQTWWAICSDPSGKTYAAVYGGDFYIQSTGNNNFVQQNQTLRNWNAIAVAPSSDVLACAISRDRLTALGQTALVYYGMCVAPDSDVYCCVMGGDIYKQTSGTGDFAALGQTNRNWWKMCAAPNGNIYACVSSDVNGQIYKQTSGVGDFVSLAQTARKWSGLAAAPSGNIYATVWGTGGKLYKQTSGAGNFEVVDFLPSSAADFRSVCVTPDGSVFVCVYIIAAGNTSSHTYKQTAGAGDFAEINNLVFQEMQSDFTGDIYGLWGGDSTIYKLAFGTTSWQVFLTHPCGSSFGLCISATGLFYISSYTLRDIYTVINNGSIYKQTSGVGDFVTLAQTSRNWSSIKAAANGNVYACVSNGDIYMQTASAGDFNALSQTVRLWSGFACAVSGNIYCCVFGGDIYMQTAGSGNFAALSQASRNWAAMAAAPNGNIYAAVYGGDIYMRTNGTGSFVALSQTSRAWTGLSVDASNNVYATTANGDIYKRTAGTGNFVALSQTSRPWSGVAVKSTGEVYACTMGGDIYKRAVFVLPFYSFGDRVMVTTPDIHKIYESIVVGTGTNIGHYPPDDDQTAPVYWLEIGSTNRWKVFDISLGTQTEQTESINFVLTPGLIDSIALLNLDATSVTITVTDPIEGVVYNVTTDLITTINVTDWYTYFFEPIVRAITLVKTNLSTSVLPPYPNATISITITNTGGIAKCGAIIVGQKYNIGAMKWSPSVGITDYSTKTQDVFGNWQIIPRAFADRMTCNLVIKNTIVDETKRQLALYRTTPIVWIGDEDYGCTIVYGYYKDFQIVLSGPIVSDCALELEGLT